MTNGNHFAAKHKSFKRRLPASQPRPWPRMSSVKSRRKDTLIGAPKMEGRRKSLRVADKASFWRPPTWGAQTSKPTWFCGMSFSLMTQICASQVNKVRSTMAVSLLLFPQCLSSFLVQKNIMQNLAACWPSQLSWASQYTHPPTHVDVGEDPLSLYGG